MTEVKQLDRVIIRFAGDSGDGMQLTGDRFTAETARLRQRPGDAARTSPPRSARPPGTLPGVSRFQLHFADHDILTPGDAPDVLVAMNPAALRRTSATCRRGGTLIVDTDDFTERNLEEGRLRRQPARGRHRSSGYQVHAVDLTALTVEARQGVRAVPQGGRARQEHVRARACCRWMYGRPTERHRASS